MSTDQSMSTNKKVLAKLALVAAKMGMTTLGFILRHPMRAGKLGKWLYKQWKGMSNQQNTVLGSMKVPSQGDINNAIKNSLKEMASNLGVSQGQMDDIESLAKSADQKISADVKKSKYKPNNLKDEATKACNLFIEIQQKLTEKKDRLDVSTLLNDMRKLLQLMEPVDPSLTKLADNMIKDLKSNDPKKVGETIKNIRWVMQLGSRLLNIAIKETGVDANTRENMKKSLKEMDKLAQYIGDRLATSANQPLNKKNALIIKPSLNAERGSGLRF